MKVICTLPNASELINGVAFKKHGEVMLSEDMSDDAAADFASIPGYEILPNDRSDEGGKTTRQTEDEAIAAEAAALAAKEAADKKAADKKATEKPSTKKP